MGAIVRDTDAMTSSSSASPVSHAHLAAVRERWLLWVLAAIQFTHIVDFMVMMPLGPELIALFHLTDASFGLLVSSYSLAAGVSGLIASVYVDRFDRKRVLLWVYAGFALATLACAWAPTYMALLCARIMAGAFGGVLGSLVQTIVGDVIPFERRGRAMGVVMSAFAMATVAGLPAALWLASLLGWHWPFLSIAVLSALCWLAAIKFVPRLDTHVLAPAESAATGNPWQRLHGVLTQPNHWRAYGLSMAMMLGSFSIIPYITIFTTTNVGLQPAQVPLVYLVGGLATLFTSRMWGKLADRHGKVFMFRCLALMAAVPMFTLTHLGPTPLWGLLIVTTAFFVFVSGRMVPGMALLTQTAQPQWRGGFMSVNSALQSAMMGVGAWLGGVMISRSPQGLLEGYGYCGWLAVVSTAVIVWWVGQLGVSEASPVHAA